jgi:hypothetical protein
VHVAAPGIFACQYVLVVERQAIADGASLIVGPAVVVDEEIVQGAGLVVLIYKSEDMEV